MTTRTVQRSASHVDTSGTTDIPEGRRVKVRKMDSDIPSRVVFVQPQGRVVSVRSSASGKTLQVPYNVAREQARRNNLQANRTTASQVKTTKE